jgi:ribonuclease E
LGIGFLRKLNLEILKNEISGVKVVVPVAVADYLLNRKRKEINGLEVKRDIRITIEGNRDMIPGESKIICDKKPAAGKPNPVD